MYGAIGTLVLSSVGCGLGETNDDKCRPFTVYSQNRWPPLGAAIREYPDLSSTKIGSFAGNVAIEVDGWLNIGKSVYPNNPSPWDSGVWYMVDGKWVAFAAVRGEKTDPDPTGGFDDQGGQPAPTPPHCEIIQ